MKFEAVRIHYLSEITVCCHPEMLLPWQRDVATTTLCYGYPVSCATTDFPTK